MQERDMVNDVLSMTKAGASDYTRAISECSNENLRNTLKQMRDGDEQFQYQLAQIAIQKNYYTPAQQANQQEMQQIKSQLMQG